MSEETAKLRLPLIAASQAQKHVTHNEALTALDTFVQASAIDKDLATPPVSPNEGDCYIVAGSPTGAWSGYATRVARYIDGVWRSYIPNAGWLVYVQDESALYTFNGSTWIRFGSASFQPLDAELTALAGLASAANTLPYFTGAGAAGLLVLDTDGTLAANSDTKVPSQKAVKTYTDALLAANDAMVFKGVIDCSANPNYPTANAGDTYRVSVAGKVGGGSGPNVEAGDILICITDGSAAGTQAAVGANWGLVQVNLDGALTTANIGVTVQGYDADTAAIAALAPANNDVIQRKSGAWTNRTMAQLMADLGALGQIPFPATQSASSDPNTLDDYEEGTFTPTFTSSGTAPTGVTYSQQTGYYTKIGRMVHFDLRITLTSKGTGGTGFVRLGGLPFTAGADHTNTSSLNATLGNVDWATGYTQGNAALVNNSALLALNAAGDNVAVSGITWTICTDTSVFQISGCYRV